MNEWMNEWMNRWRIRVAFIEDMTPPKTICSETLAQFLFYSKVSIHVILKPQKLLYIILGS